MEKKYVSAFFALATLIISLVSCNTSPGPTTPSPLTETWRVEGKTGEYMAREIINDTNQIIYAFDSGNNIISAGKTLINNVAAESIFKISSGGQKLWSVPFDTGSWPSSLILDNSDDIFNLYSVGYVNQADPCGIAKYSKDGALLWQNPDIETTFGMSIVSIGEPVNTDMSISHAIDQAGNIFVLGAIGEETGIVKINSSGDVLWRQSAAVFPRGIELTKRMMCDTLGNLYVGYAYTGVAYIRVLKFDGITGSLLWDKTCIDGYMSNFNWMLDTTGNLIITAVTSNKGAGIFKFDASGKKLWEYTHTPTETGIESWTFVRSACDSNGNVIMTVAFNLATSSNTIILPLPEPVPITHYYGDSYLRQIKIDKDGKELWSNMLVSDNNVEQIHQRAADIWLDKNNDMYLFPVDGSLIKYNSNGNKQWTFEPDTDISDWHVDNDLNLYGIYAGNETNGYVVTKYKQN